MNDGDSPRAVSSIRGITLMIGAVASLTVLDSTAKFLSRDLRKRRKREQDQQDHQGN